MKSIGKKIKELRRAKGMSQKDLADRLGITGQAVSKWENDTSLPEMTMLPDLAAVFGIQIDDLFEYSTEKRYESIAKKIEYERVLTNQEFAEEESFLLQEIQSAPEKYEAVSLLGDLYRHQANCMNKKAVHYAKQALTLRPNQKNDLNNINNACNGPLIDWDAGNHHELIQYYEELIQKEPANTRACLFLLDALIDAGRLSDAEKVLAESGKEITEPLNEYYEIWIQEKRTGFHSVKEAYERLMEKYRTDWKVLFSVANSYCYNERYEEAIPIWQAAFDNMPGPRFTDPYEAIAQCCIRLGEPKRAAEYYRKELELLRDEWDIRYGDSVDALKDKIRKLEA